MAFYADRMRTALTGRAGDWLARHAWPHLTMVVVFSLSAWAAHECSLHILHWGGLAVRFSITFLAAYVTFVACLGFWLWTKPSLDRSALLDDAAESIETKNPWDDEATESREQLIEHATRSAEQQGRQQGLVGLAIAAMIVGTLFVAFHMIWYARWYLGRLFVLGGKIRDRTLPGVPAGSWFIAPLQLTGWAAVILLVHYALLGLLLQWMFPQAVTVADILRQGRP